MTSHRSKPLGVVIPVKNDLPGLRETLEALWMIDPEGQQIEIAVVDAGTCDETGGWLLEHMDRIDHIRSAADNGLYDAMNYGVSSLSSAWVWFLGAGDLAHSSTISDLLNACNEWDNTKLHVYSVDMLLPLESGVPSAYPARWDNSITWRNTTHHQGVFYPRALLQGQAFSLEYPVLADYALHLKLFHSGCQAHLHEESSASVSSGGVSRSFQSRLYLEEWKIKKRILKGPVQWIQPVWLFLKFLFKKTGLPQRS
jgi:putative colanic acid biosynthesis glycosyltransferase